MRQGEAETTDIPEMSKAAVSSAVSSAEPDNTDAEIDDELRLRQQRRERQQRRDLALRSWL